MKRVLLFFILAGCSSITLLSQKPKQTRPEQPVVLRPQIDTNQPAIVENQPAFQGTTKIKTIAALKRPAQTLPNDFKIITSENGLPTMVSGSLPATQGRETTLEARGNQYLTALKSVMQIENPADEFLIKNQETDDDGLIHVRMSQQYKGLPVWGSEIILHERNSSMYLMNGHYFPTPSVTKLEPSVAQQPAEKIVESDLIKNYRFKTLNEDALKQVGGQQFRSELVIFHVNDNAKSERLAWHITAHANVLHRFEYFVDAQTGEILNHYETSCTISGHVHGDRFNTNNHTDFIDKNTENTPSTEGVALEKPVMDGAAVADALDLFNLTRRINTYQVGTTYFLIDASRGMYKANLSTMPKDPVGVIQTLDARNTDDGPYYYITSTNNSWSNTRGISAHYNAGKAYEYYLTKFNRNSINGKGGNITSFINVTENSQGMDNAYWNGEAMFYGNGDQAFTALAKALDVAGHEISHGVIQNTANLRYQGESGALNESFADIFGAMIDRDDWTMGEDIIKDKTSFPTGALRSLSDPHNGGTSLNSPSYQPKVYSERYTGTQDNGGVHINSGITNYAFYLFATNSSVGKDKAEQIFYAALTKYLVASSKFIDLRAAVEQVCKDRNDNAALAAAQSAFNQVGIGSGGSAGGTNYQKDIQTNTGQDYVVFVSPDNSKLQLAVPGGSQVITLSTKGVTGKPSVTDDGTKIFFVGKDKRIYQISFNWTNNTYSESTFDNQTIWNNVAISRDGSKLAVNASDSAIYVYSFALNQTKEFLLYNPTTAQGNLTSNEVKYSDILEWDHFGENVMYDAYNELDLQDNSVLSYWDIGFMNVWSNTNKTWAKGTIYKLFSDLPETASVGNPTFSKNSPYIIAFDYIETDGQTESNYILGANIETGAVTANNNGIFKNNTLGYPSFSTKDDKILITNEDILGNQRLITVPIQTNKIEPNGTSTTTVSTAQIGNWFSNGKRVISAVEDKLDEHLVKIAPNPFSSDVNIEIQADKSSQARAVVYDLLGRNVASYPLSIEAGKNAFTLPSSNLTSGTYLLKITLDGKYLTRRIVKM